MKSIDDDGLVQALARFSQLAIFEDYKLLSPESPGMDGDTPLHVAAFDGDIGALESLLPYVSNIDVRGDIGNTALHSAIAFKRTEMVELLIRYGADVMALNDYDDSPLDMMMRSPEFDSLLRAHGWLS